MPNPQRVAHQYLLQKEASAFSASPAALRLLKVMASGAGKTSTLNLNLLAETLSLLGWTVSEGSAAVRLTDSDQLEHLLAKFLQSTKAEVWGYTGTKEPKEFWFSTEDEAQKGAALLSRTVPSVGLKGPTGSPQVGDLFLGEIQTPPYLDARTGSRWIVWTMGWWMGVPSWTIRTTTGASVEVSLSVDSRGRIASPLEAKIPSFWTWGYKNGLQEAASAFLESVGQDSVAKILQNPEMRSLENTGTCPVCEVNVKLTRNTIMRHGWNVVGRGWGQYGQSWHTTSCYGVGFAPFELSSLGAVEYLRMLKPKQQQAEQKLAVLNTSPAEFEYWSERAKKLVNVVRPENWNPQDYSPEGRLYTQALSTETRQLTKVVEEMTLLQRTLEAKIQSWEPRPLPGARG